MIFGEIDIVHYLLLLLSFLAGFQPYMYAMEALANTLSLQASRFYVIWGDVR